MLTKFSYDHLLIVVTSEFARGAPDEKEPSVDKERKQLGTVRRGSNSKERPSDTRRRGGEFRRTRTTTTVATEPATENS